MRQQKESPGAGTPGHDIHEETKPSKIISQNDILFPLNFLPRHISEKLIKIAAFWGVPAQILAESEITKFVLRHWNRVENRPVKE